MVGGGRRGKIKFYVLPKLPYIYKELEPYISEDQLKIHHQKHHQGCVNGANYVFEELEKAREEGVELDIKSTLKTLSFNIEGHITPFIVLALLGAEWYWRWGAQRNLRQCPKERVRSFERFKSEFSQVTVSVEGSGLAALSFCKRAISPKMIQVEKHNANIYPTFRILMVLDV